MLIFNTLLILQSTETYTGFKCVLKLSHVFISRCFEPPGIVTSLSVSSFKYCAIEATGEIQGRCIAASEYVRINSDV